MKTILAAVFLVVIGGLTTFFGVFVLNIAGLPGALLAWNKKQASKGRVMLAIILACLGQSYVYLAYTAFIVNWTGGASARNDAPLGFLLWIPAFLAVLLPIYKMLIVARVEAKESGVVGVQVEALHFTTCVAILGFIVFAFIPSIIKLAWGWVPYVR